MDVKSLGAAVAIRSVGPLKTDEPGEELMLSPRAISVGVAALGLAIAMTSSGHAADITKVKLYPDKKGTAADFQPMSQILRHEADQGRAV